MEKYFSFQGRMKRQDYWVTMVVALVAAVVGLILVEEPNALNSLLALVSLVASLWLLVAATIKRLRDAGLNVMWALLLFVPYVGNITTIVLGCIPSAEE